MISKHAVTIRAHEDACQRVKHRPTPWLSDGPTSKSRKTLRSGDRGGHRIGHRLTIECWGNCSSSHSLTARILRRRAILLEPFKMVALVSENSWKRSVRHIKIILSCHCVVGEEWANYSVLPETAPLHYTATTLLLTCAESVRVNLSK